MTHDTSITTHVLDTSLGKPAAGVQVKLARRLGEDDRWEPLGTTATNSDGRAGELLHPGAMTVGVYRLTFATGDYFQSRAMDTFYPTVIVEFQIDSPDGHAHVPLLISPFGYSTYRGS